MPIKNQYSQLSKQVVHPVHKCPSVAIWYDEISCCFWDQSTLEPYISRTERVGTLQQAVSRSCSSNRLRQLSGAIPSPRLRTSSFFRHRRYPSVITFLALYHIPPVRYTAIDPKVCPWQKLLQVRRLYFTCLEDMATWPSNNQHVAQA